MAEEWFTYSDLGERLGISAEAVRQKAIRHRWRRQTANDGKTMVLVDVTEVNVMPRKPKEDPSDSRPTGEEPPADTRTLDVLEDHIATLRAILAKAEAATERERGRADSERDRADRERDRADQERVRVDAERDRADSLFAQIESLVADRAEKAAERVKADADRDRFQAEIKAERDRLQIHIQELRATIEAAARRPWWKRLAG